MSIRKGGNIIAGSDDISIKTNCITKIPQDINLELNNGTLTLKSGSKVYVPDGSGVFDVVTISGDKTYQLSANGQITVYYSPSQSSIRGYYSSADVSGTTAPTTYGTWYDTANNLIKRYDSGTVTVSGLSFPIARVTVSNGAISSIDQVFNGFGYIGSTVFALPGVKGLIPNGRNTDGTLKNTPWTTNSVITRTFASNESFDTYIGIDASQFYRAATFNVKYNEKDNLIYLGGVKWGCTLFATATLTSGVISNFVSKTPFHAVDYGDVYTKMEIDNTVVHKSGSETITGAKSFTALPQLLITTTTAAATYQDIFVQKDSNLDTTTDPTYNKSYYLSVKDKNNRYLGYISSAINTSGSSTMTMYARTRNTGNTGDVTAGISVTAKRDGTFSTYVPSPTEATTTSTQIDTVGARQTAILSKISNCVTEIPQDIKLELSNGTLTLKSGSKVYFPNGTGVFTEYNFTSDKTVSITANGKFLAGIGNTSKNIALRAFTSTTSGATDSMGGQGYHWWYDTTNNVIKSYSSDTTTPSDTISLPIAIITVSEGAISSIDQVFNGFGFIGSTIFALPGVKALAAAGRKTDGTLNNILVTLDSVKTFTSAQMSARAGKLGIQNGGTITFFIGYSYNETANRVYNYGLQTAACAADLVYDGSRFTSLTPKTAFHAADYNDVYTRDYADTLLNDKADRSLSNLTATGKNIANWSSNVSNCIIRIPQDINLTLSNGTLTLKAGSKVYKPDGTYVTITSDISINTAPSGTTIVCVHSNGSALYTQYPTNIVSGATDSKAGETYHWWFDTTNNVINRYTNNGTTPSQTLAFPIAIITSPNGTISSIDQIFNGAGYIGHHAFTLPNVIALLPMGVDFDGTLKSTERKPGQVYVVEMNTGLYNGYGRTISIIGGNPVNNSASYVEIKDRSEAVSQAWVRQYVSSENIIIARTSDNGPFVEFSAGAYPPQTPFIFYNYDGTNVTKFDVVQPMRVVNYNDTSFISHQTTPSNKQTSLTLGASGSTYTMPSDGYICVRKETTATNQYIDIIGRTRISSTNSIAGEAISLTLRVSKGEVIQVDYNAAGNTSFFKFVYDIGAK